MTSRPTSRRPPAKEGDDQGRLAAVGASQAEGTAEAENGMLDIPVAAAGLAYKFADAKAPAGAVNVKSENPQSVRTTSRSRATASTRRARSSRAAARPSSRPTCSRASTRSSAPCPATARVAWKASSPSSSAGARDGTASPEADVRVRCRFASNRSLAWCRPRERQLRAWFEHVQGRGRRWAVRHRYFGRPLIEPGRDLGRRCVVSVELAHGPPPVWRGCSAALDQG